MTAILINPVVNANQHLLVNDQSEACVAGSTPSLMVSNSDVRTVSFFSPPSSTAANPNARPLGADETKGRLTRIKGLDPDKSTKKYWAVNSLHTVNKSYVICKVDRAENARRRVRLPIK